VSYGVGRRKQETDSALKQYTLAWHGTFLCRQFSLSPGRGGPALSFRTNPENTMRQVPCALVTNAHEACLI
jgi:hypothetical protein